MNLRYLQIITFIFLGIWVLFTLLFMDVNVQKKSKLQIATFNSAIPKKILIWTSVWNRTFSRFRNEDFANCPVSNCVIINDTYQVEQADAVIFHAIRSDIHNKSLPKVRHPFQRYVFYTLESELITYVPDWPGFFNLTMTYRLDSDVVNTYGYYRERKVPELRNETINYAKGKTKMAAWFVSNCKMASKRDDLVKVLQKYIEVDIYGRCGNMSCKKNGINHQNPDCMKMIESKYKFYLSFENSLCPDYVTEKLFVPLHYNIIPITYGAVNYSLFAPPYSYINVLDFKDVKELADYLILLDRNDEMYNQYFTWREKYLVSNVTYGWCDICEKLNRKDDPPKIYEDVSKWWKTERCTWPKNDYWLNEKTADVANSILKMSSKVFKNNKWININ